MIERVEKIYNKAFGKGLKPDPLITIDEWADKYRFLPKESSAESGLYRTSRVPYTKEIMQELSPISTTQEIVVVKPTQVGITEVANNFLFCTADLYPGPTLFAMPTEQMARNHSKKKIAPSLEYCSRLKKKIKPAKGRDGGNTILTKEFPGGSWRFVGSNSPTAARSDSIKYLVIDDYDGFELTMGEEGNPADLLKKRTDTFSNKKIYINSTPTIKGASNIEIEYESSSQGEYNVPCPHCGEFQYLIFSQLKFKRDEKGALQEDSIYYECKHCEQKIFEYEKTKLIANGKYIHKYPERKKRGFRFNSLVSPIGWVSWSRIIQEFLEAKDNKEKLQVWKNTRMAESFEEEGTKLEYAVLQARAEPYQINTVPSGGLVLVAGVDTQDNRLEVLVQAFGRDEECWNIYQTQIFGEPDTKEVWEQLDYILNQPYRHQSGVDLHILSMGIDTGGHFTQAVYNYARSRAPKVFALKGSSTHGKPIVNRPSLQDVDFDGRKIKGGVELWTIGTDTAKSLIYNRLKIQTPGPGYYHFPIGLDIEFYKQLTAEKLVRRFVKNVAKTEWVKTRKRNDVLDCAVYCLAAAHKTGISMIDFDKIEKNLLNTNNGVRIDQKSNKVVRKRMKNIKKVGYQRPKWMDR